MRPTRRSIGGPACICKFTQGRSLSPWLAAVDSGAGAHSDDAATGRKRHVDQIESESSPAETKASEKRKSGAKSKRAKSDSASATDKSRKSKAGARRTSQPLKTRKARPQHLPRGGKDRAVRRSPVAECSSARCCHGGKCTRQGQLRRQRLGAAEALGALAGLFGAAPPSEAGVRQLHPPLLTRQLSARGQSRQEATQQDGSARRGRCGRGHSQRTRTTTDSSYWSVAERSEFCALWWFHGPSGMLSRRRWRKSRCAGEETTLRETRASPTSPRGRR